MNNSIFIDILLNEHYLIYYNIIIVYVLTLHGTVTQQVTYLAAQNVGTIAKKLKLLSI
jgi:hypothetical protein